jgi:DNA repair exonuclease SbcCD ATPase subunit
MSVNDQRNFIEELFRISELSQKAIALKEEIKQTEQSTEIEKAIIKEKEIQIASRKRHISEAENRIVRWEEDRVNEIEKISYKLERIDGVDFDAESEKINKKNELIRSLNELSAKSKELSKSSIQITKEIKKFSDELIHLKDAKCPYCLQQFENAESKIADIENNINILNKELSAKTAESLDNDVVIDSVKSSIDALNKTIVNTDIADLLKIKAQADSLIIQRAKLETDLNPHLEAYDALVAEDAVAIVDTEKLDKLHNLLEHQKFLLKLLSDKNSFIRKTIISKSIPFLNKQIEFYIKELLLPHVVTFEPDMSCSISEYGRELDHGNLSAGEQKRLNLALSLAFRDVLTHLHMKINMLLCDEIDGGSLCITTMNSLIHLLKKKSRDDAVNIWCISHSAEFDGRLDNTMIIRKENGFSDVVTDD